MDTRDNRKPRKGLADTTISTHKEVSREIFIKIYILMNQE